MTIAYPVYITLAKSKELVESTSSRVFKFKSKGVTGLFNLPVVNLVQSTWPHDHKKRKYLQLKLHSKFLKIGSLNHSFKILTQDYSQSIIHTIFTEEKI